MVSAKGEAEMTALALEEMILEMPMAALERTYVEEYLKEKGYTLEGIQELPSEEQRKLMVEACRYASFKLAEVEAKGKFSRKIHEE
jgi:hypothetical protein